MGSAFVATHASGTASTFDDVPDWDLIRVSALDLDEDTADALATEFHHNKNMYVIKAVLPYNGLWAVDFTLAGVDKASGIARVGQTLGVNPTNMVAVGDSYNDLPMLSMVGDPCAINPDSRLRAHAREAAWRVRDYRTGRKAARAGLVVGAAAGALSGTVAAGVALRSRRR